MTDDSATSTTSGAHDAGARCENCSEPLQGTYCHQCGQSRHDPTQHLGHAIEELFESVWHLDGRIFRTLRDLLVPGRVALDYLAGHRVRYIAPFRLFVILSLITFFVANLTAEIPDTQFDDAIQVDADSDLGRATTVAEVERLRDDALADIAKQRRQLQLEAPAAAAPDAGEAAVRRAAVARIAALRAAPGKDGAANPATAQAAGAAGDPRAKATPEAAWDAAANPIRLAWLPAFANDWLTGQSDRASRNVLRIRDNPATFVHALIGAVPTALFLLVPVFALLLKLAYLLKRRLYLEHLVVALYSHAFLLLSLLLLFLLAALGNALPAGAPATVLGVLAGALWIWMPLYLLLMQKRVYGQGWPLTVLKYAVVGTLYFVLLGFGAAFLVTYVLVKM